jgi:hypothetical protein
MFFCEPFGKTDPDSLVNYGNDTLREHNYTLLWDQEPIHLDIHTQLFDAAKRRNVDLNFGNGPMHSALITSEHNSEFVEQVCSLYSWKPYYYFFHGWAAMDWYRGYDRTFLIAPPKERTITRTFIAPNRIVAGERQHRLEVLYHIFKHGMLENHISCPAVCPAENISIHDAVKPLVGKYPDIQDVFAKQSLPINFAGETDHPMHSCWLSLFDESAESLLYLVNETVATGRRCHLTEKTFKPICMQMPFVLVSTAGSLDYLRSYGFKTFSDLWDEQYDLIADSRERLTKITEVMQQIANWDPVTRLDKMTQAQAIADYNKKWFFSEEWHTNIINEYKNNFSNAMKIMTENITAGYTKKLQQLRSDSTLIPEQKDRTRKIFEIADKVRKKFAV